MRAELFANAGALDGPPTGSVDAVREWYRGAQGRNIQDRSRGGAACWCVRTGLCVCITPVNDLSANWCKGSPYDEVPTNSGVILVVWKCFVMMFSIILQKIVAEARIFLVKF